MLFNKGIFPFGKKNNPVPYKETGFGSYIKKDIFVMWFKVLAACIPAAVVGLLLDDWIDEHLYNPWTVAIALIVFGIAFIVVENWNKNKTPKVNSISDLTYKMAFITPMLPTLVNSV